MSIDNPRGTRNGHECDCDCHFTGANHVAPCCGPPYQWEQLSFDVQDGTELTDIPFRPRKFSELTDKLDPEGLERARQELKEELDDYEHNGYTTGDDRSTEGRARNILLAKTRQSICPQSLRGMGSNHERNS